MFGVILLKGVGVHAWGSVAPVPSESECRPYIEKALKELSTETTQGNQMSCRLNFQTVWLCWDFGDIWRSGEVMYQI